MYISPISITIPYQKTGKNSQCNKLQIQPQLTKDVVSFGTRNIFFPSYNYKELEKFPEYLYRAIDKTELQNLLRGLPVGKQKYCSINPMGWNAQEWWDGFKADFPSTYFVTFKKNHFDSNDIYQMDNHDFNTWNKVRFIIDKEISIKDIESIREGNNARGKIIWAASRKIKTDDRAKKLEYIEKCLNSKKLNEKLDDIDNLRDISTLVKEFPEIVDRMIKMNIDTKYTDYLIYKSANRKFLPYIKQRIENNDNLHCEIIHYLNSVGTNKELDLVLKCIENKPINSLFYADTLGKIVKEKDIPLLKEMALSDNSVVTSRILEYFDECSLFFDDAVDTARKVLNKYQKSLSKTQYKLQKEDEYNIYKCANILGKYGNESDDVLLGYFKDIKLEDDSSVFDHYRRPSWKRVEK